MEGVGDVGASNLGKEVKISQLYPVLVSSTFKDFETVYEGEI